MAKPKLIVPGARKTPGTTKQTDSIPPVQPPVPPPTELAPPTPPSEPSVDELTPPAPPATEIETPPAPPIAPLSAKKKSAEEVAKEKLIAGYRKQYPNNKVFYLTSDNQIFLADAQNLAALHQRSLKSGELETINE